jgi:hypothetical protein
MTKNKNPAAALELNESFMRRLSALTGKREPNANDFQVLLEAGLQAMEAFASDSDDGCGNPECIDCRIQSGGRPRPALVAEFDAVRQRLHQAADDREAGNVLDRPVTIMMTEACLIFAAWLDRLMTQRGTSGMRVVGPNINLDRPADMDGAGRFLAHLLVQSLEAEMARFAEGRHPLLFPPCDAGPSPKAR